jgi:hypothetical protein
MKPGPRLGSRSGFVYLSAPGLNRGIVPGRLWRERRGHHPNRRLLPACPSRQIPVAKLIVFTFRVSNYSDGCRIYLR